MKTALAVTIALLAVALGGSAVAGPRSDRSQARAWAQAINLRPGDVGAFGIVPPGQVDGLDTNVLRSNKCGTIAPRKDEIAYVPSSLFARSDRTGGNVSLRTVWSGVSVLKAAPQARLEVAGLVSRAAIACLRRAVRTTAPRGFTITTSVVKLRRPVPGAVGLRIKATLSDGHESVSLFGDVFAFARGPAVVTLVTNGIGTEFGAYHERRLVKTLKLRAVRQIPEPDRLEGSPELQG